MSEISLLYHALTDAGLWMCIIIFWVPSQCCVNNYKHYGLKHYPDMTDSPFTHFFSNTSMMCTGVTPGLLLMAQITGEPLEWAQQPALAWYSYSGRFSPTFLPLVSVWCCLLTMSSTSRQTWVMWCCSSSVSAENMWHSVPWRVQHRKRRNRNKSIAFRFCFVDMQSLLPSSFESSGHVFLAPRLAPPSLSLCWSLLYMLLLILLSFFPQRILQTSASFRQQHSVFAELPLAHARHFSWLRWMWVC